MGARNILVEGGSGTGKTAVCHELRRRGFAAINGDRELAYQGDPATGAPHSGATGVDVHRFHLWDADAVTALVADRTDPVTFLCGGSRNRDAFVDLFDDVIVLEVDLATLRGRLAERPSDEWGGAGRDAERAVIERLHRTGEDMPRDAVVIDSSGPVDATVDVLLRRLGLDPEVSSRGR